LLHEIIRTQNMVNGIAIDTEIKLPKFKLPKKPPTVKIELVSVTNSENCDTTL
jgi:hypothetical protein